MQEASATRDSKFLSDMTERWETTSNTTSNGNVSTYKNKIKDLGSEANIPGKEVHLGYYTYTMTEVGNLSVTTMVTRPMACSKLSRRLTTIKTMVKW